VECKERRFNWFLYVQESEGGDRRRVDELLGKIEGVASRDDPV
jgi:hypothetical protein